MRKLFGGLVITGLLVSVAHADRAATIAGGNKTLAEEVERFNRESKFTFPIEVDWASVPDLEKDRDAAKNWAERCGDFITKLRPLCTSDEKAGAIAACSDHMNQKVKKMRCVVEADSAKERVEFKNDTLHYYMVSGSDSTAKEKVPKTLRTLFPGVAPIVLQHDVDAYLEKQDPWKTAKMTADTASFTAGGFTGLSGIVTYCVPMWDVLRMLNHPECQLKTCKGDGAKKKKFLEGATQMRCVHSKEPKVAERKGDTLIVFVGEWASKVGSLTGIPFAAYDQLRTKLKIRDCGVDDKSTDPRGGGGVMTSEARQKCCPKGADNKCVKVVTDKWEEVCTVAGFTTEKACHKRDLLKKDVIDKAK